jgi:hypothetical protein
MADPNIGQLAASVWEAKIGKKPTDSIFTSRALFYALGKKGFKEQSDGGRLIELPVQYAENTTFKSYGEFDLLDTTRIDVFDAARFDWRIAAGTVVYSELERLRAQGSNQKFDVLAEKLENGKDSHIANMNRQMWSDGSGNGGKDFGGMQLIISTTPTTGIVGGINRATFSWWRNRQVTGTQTTTAFDNLRSTLTSCYNQCSLGGLKKQPTAIITTRTVMEGYEGTLTPNMRYDRSDHSNHGDAGFDNDALQFKGAPIFYDEDAPAGNAYLLNNENLKLVYLKGGWMKMYPEVDPSNQLANVHKVATFANMCTNASRHLGVVNAIT